MVGLLFRQTQLLNQHSDNIDGIRLVHD